MCFGFFSDRSFQLVPSLDLNSSYVDHPLARRLIDHFLDDFPLSRQAHFGTNLAAILMADRGMLDAVQKRVQKIFLSVEVDERNAQAVRRGLLGLYRNPVHSY